MTFKTHLFFGMASLLFLNACGTNSQKPSGATFLTDTKRVIELSYQDVNLDGIVNTADDPILDENYRAESVSFCEGDTNLDGIVDDIDVQNFKAEAVFSVEVEDVNKDGKFDHLDYRLIVCK